MLPVSTETTTTLQETISSFEVFRRFSDLRGVQWRIDLGILPPSPSSSIDDLRRVTADARRRYAALRRQLLVDPHIWKDGSSSPDLVMDNPLSQNPDSMWGRFFKNAELERMVDQDLTRLYPEHGSYFQTSACQGILRRILLLWCLRHPDYGYRQGMHELLAPLLYVLHVDVEHLSEVRKTHEDHFTDKFDVFSFHENDLTYKFDFKKFSDSEEDWNGSGKSSVKSVSPRELDPKIQSVVLLSDAYGAEGELGIVISEKFMEHDAYCMFDALMNGSGGAVAMAEFFSPSPFDSSHSGFPPVIEASSAVYLLLSTVDSSLHSHLVELGVEPQYFALRWLRVLFGREFALEDLLIIWDEIFACQNCKFNKLIETDKDSNFGVLDSMRGAFISALAVSMILYLRSSLLSTENATSCLQRLLNFPNDVNLEKLLKNAKSLQSLAMDTNNSNSLLVHAEVFDKSSSTVVRGHSRSMDSTSPKTPLSLVRDCYWEEKWRVLHTEEERRKQDALEKQTPIPQRSWSEKVKVNLSRTGSAPTASKIGNRKKEPKLSVRRNLLEDLVRQLGLDDDNIEKIMPTAQLSEEGNGGDGSDANLSCISPQIANSSSEETSSIYSDLLSPVSGVANNDCENLSGRSSVASNSSIDESDGGTDPADLQRTTEEALAESNLPNVSVESQQNKDDEEGLSLHESDLPNMSLESQHNKDDEEGLSLPESDLPNVSVQSQHKDTDEAKSPLPESNMSNVSVECGEKDNDEGSGSSPMKVRKPLGSKFQWFWKLGKGGGGGDGISDKGMNTKENQESIHGMDRRNCTVVSAVANGGKVPAESSKADNVDQNMMVTLRNIGQSMLDNIQVIETVFQQDRTQGGAVASKNALVGKGQVTAMAALKELRKISNLLSEM